MTAAEEPRYEVVWPQGQVVTSAPRPIAPRLTGFDRKRVALVWDHVFRGDEMFEVFAEVVRSRWEAVTFIPHERFGNVHGSVTEEHEAIALLPDRLRELEVDAAIVGVGA
jgi:hypothetical protein